MSQQFLKHTKQIHEQHVDYPKTLISTPAVVIIAAISSDHKQARDVVGCGGWRQWQASDS